MHAMNKAEEVSKHDTGKEFLFFGLISDKNHA